MHDATALMLVTRAAAATRVALILFAAMCIIAYWRNRSDRTPLDRWRSRAMLLVAIGALAFSPTKIGWLLGRPLPLVAARGLDVVGAGFVCAAMIHQLAVWGALRGISADRIRRGVAVNVLVVAAIVSAAWLAH